MKKIKIQIKNRFTGSVLFEYEKEENTIKDTVEEAVNNGANLGDADLRGAYIGGADIGGAYLRGAYLIGADLRGAYLRGANLRGVYLRDAYLRDANLGGANLGGANLGGADLGGANLRGANLGGADLRGADLGGADLRAADLRGADLGGANLRAADLRGAYLRDAYLRGAKYIPFIPMDCPTDGDFIGWKKVNYGEKNYLVKLMVPADAKRCSSTGRKCRCSKALVLDITLLVDGKEAGKEKYVINNYYVPTLYEVGKVVEPDSFDEDRFKECSHGIHFFIDRQEAINY